MDTIEVGTAVATAPGRFDGMLKVAELPDGQTVEIPATIVRGAKDGPVLWMHGCVHGNEYCGAYIIQTFLRALEPAQLRGSVVALPFLNLTASQRNQRMSPFEGYNVGDLNRCFRPPWDGPDGAVAAEALQLLREAQPEALIVGHRIVGRVDMHSLDPQGRDPEPAGGLRRQP